MRKQIYKIISFICGSILFQSLIIIPLINQSDDLLNLIALGCLLFNCWLGFLLGEQTLKLIVNSNKESEKSE